VAAAAVSAVTQIYNISEVFFNSRLVLEAWRRSFSTPGFSSKSAAAVSNGRGTSPYPSAPSVPVIDG
jgi:hypothetical protein